MFLILALVIGALTGLAVVAFILLTERMGMRLVVRQNAIQCEALCNQQHFECEKLRIAPV